MNRSVSPSKERLLKLIKKKTALFGLLFILVSAILSLFAYYIIDDNTPNANTQQAEIALKKAGFKTDALIIASKKTPAKQNFFRTLLFGKEKDFSEQPFKELLFLSDKVEILTHYDQKRYFSFEDILFEQDRQNIDRAEEIIEGKHIVQKSYLLGTDRYGRSILSRLILGIRVSLLVGLLAVVISLLVGVTLGSLAGYYGGWADQIILFFINVTWSIPTLLLVFAIVLALGRGIGIIFLAVGLTMWVDVARIVRGQVLQVKEDQYVMAAKSIGINNYVILFKHILPNIIGPLLVIAAANFATAILIEAGLSYLGFGIKPPAPSIGNMLNEHYGYAITGKPFLAIVPAVTIMLLVLAFNLVGSGLRDVFDVKDEK